MCSGSEEGTHLRLIDFCITELVSLKESFGFLVQLRQAPIRLFRGGLVFKAHRLVYHSTLGEDDLSSEIGSEEGSYLRLIDVCITQL